MTERAWPELNDDVREAWDENATFWDERMGEGNAFHSQLNAPAAERLLAIQAGERVLDIACGNGQFSRRLTELGASVVAVDLAPRMIEVAKARTAARPELAGRIDFRVLDATDETAWSELEPGSFEAAVCIMAVMDMSELGPMLAGLRRALAPGGRFVFVITHPCFNHCGMRLSMEEGTAADGQIYEERSVKIVTYRSNGPSQGIAMVGQPRTQWYFDRTLSELLTTCFAAGYVLDGLEEPAFENANPEPRAFGWSAQTEIPPVLAARLRPF